MIGDVFMMKFSGSGNEQRGWRPGVVFQNNTGNKHSPNVIAFPMTSKIKKENQPTHVIIRSEESDLPRDSMVLCENPERMSRENIGDFIGRLSPKHIREIAVADILASSAIAFLDVKDVIALMPKAAKLNNIIVE